MYVCKPSDFPSASDVPRIQIARFGAGRRGRKKPKEAPGGRADEHNRGQPCFRSARIPLCLHARASPATGSEPSACEAATASVQPAVLDGTVRPAVSRSPEVSGSEVAGHCPVEPGTDRPEPFPLRMRGLEGRVGAGSLAPSGRREAREAVLRGCARRLRPGSVRNTRPRPRGRRAHLSLSTRPTGKGREGRSF